MEAPLRAHRLRLRGHVARLRLLARARRSLRWLLLVAPLLLVVLADVATRGDRLLGLRGKHVVSYAFAMLFSALMWGVLLFVASARRGALRWVAAGAFVVLATLSVGGQLYFHKQYSTYLNLDATLWGTSLSESLFGQLAADGENFVRSIAPPLLLAAVLVWLGRRFVRPARTTKAVVAKCFAPALVVLAFLLPCSYRTVQASTPDVIYFHAIGGLVQALVGVRTAAQVRPGIRTPMRVPALTANPPRPRNVLFILTESVRADCHCSELVEHCPIAPVTNAAAPARMPLTQMRANSSTTAIELAVLWSGLEPIESREALHSAPLLFEYAHAAGIESAYWTSHHMMFANSRLFVQDLPTRFQCGATDLDPLADIDLGARDELLTARIRSELPELAEPFFAVAHYGNTHVPFRVDPEHAPFSPASESKGPDDNEAYRNYYKNAVYLQDRTIGDLVEFVRSSPFGERTVIVFTSDHGESFREHGQLGHTGSVFDEEIHVPGWIDAPADTLTDAEISALRSAADQPTFHTDLTPTMLDLLGLWDETAIDQFKKAMPGSSLLRPERRMATLAMTNCSGIWGCAFQNWGAMRGTRKVAGREWEQTWRCFDVATDPEEKNDLPLDQCADLVSFADRTFGGPPGAH